MNKGLLIAGVGIVVAGIAVGAVLLRPSGPETGGKIGGSTRPDPPVVAPAAPIDPKARALFAQKLEAIGKTPEAADARAALGLAYQANGLHAQAAIAYEQALDAEPEHARWWYHLARARHELGRLEPALSAIDGAIRHDGRYAPAHARRGFWLLEMGRIDDARRSFSNALELDASCVPAAIGAARVHLARGANDEAVRALESLRLTQPNDAHVRMLLGTAQRAAGQHDAARINLFVGAGTALAWTRHDRWLEDLRPYEVGYKHEFKLASTLADAGQHQRAATMFEQLLSEYPDDVPVVLRLSGAYLAQRRFDRAEAVLTTALRAHEDHFALHLNLAQLRAAQDQLQPALEAADRAIELNPQLAAGHLQRARILVQMNRHREAEEAATTTMRLDAGDLRHHLLLAETQYFGERKPAAAETLRNAIASFPDAVDPLIMLADLCVELARVDEARDALNAARLLRPNDPEVRRRLNELPPGPG